jgi:glutamine synthetase
LGETYDYGNFYLLPDPTTLVALPWAPGTGLILADPYLSNGQPAISSRLVLKQAIEAAAQVDLKLIIGIEVESSIFPLRDVPEISERRHLFTALGQGLAAPVLTPLWDTLERMNIGLDAFANEFAGGEIEFNLSPRPALQAVDEFVLLKLAAREMLRTEGYDITFMAMFDGQHQGLTSGLHLHQSGINAEGRSVFFDPETEHGLAQTLLHYLGGQLSQARHLAAFSTPTITGYKRYRPGTWAPTSVTWSLDNRTTMLRVMPDRGQATRVENRLPDSAANPYLALAAMIVAGVEGIRGEIDPGPPTTGDAATTRVALPRNLWEALQCLEESSAITAFLGTDFTTAYRGLLLQTADRFEAHVTDWEIAEYRGIL